MPIFSTSRYAQAKVTRLPDENGVFNTVIVPSPPQELRFQYTEYLVVDGDRADLLAYQYLGDPSAWWMLADANPEIQVWTELVPGTILRIPRVS